MAARWAGVAVLPIVLSACGSSAPAGSMSTSMASSGEDSGASTTSSTNAASSGSSGVMSVNASDATTDAPSTTMASPSDAASEALADGESSSEHGTSDGGMEMTSPSDGAVDGGATLNAAVVSLMRRVADYQLESVDDEKDWIHGAMWTGIMATYQITGDAKYLTAIKNWAGPGWTLADGAASRGDDQCAAQTYFDAYLLDPTPANMVMLAGAKPSFDQIVANPPAGRVAWWWQDALFMVPPGFVRLGAATGDTAYVSVLDGMWWDTYAFLFDTTKGLMYRDDMHRTAFWGRGNGWVVAAIARVLEYLPADDAKRANYVTMLATMATALKPVQGSDGMWRSNLLVPTQYPNPETSGSGLITYGIAWGVHHGVLDRATYLPVVDKAWQGLTTVVGANGFVGYVQPVGSAPGPAAATDTAPYGVGAFLLAASEVASLLP